MRLVTAHKILIGTAVIFFFGFSLWELRHYFEGAGVWALVRSAIYLAVAGGFGIYLGTLRRWLK